MTGIAVVASASDAPFAESVCAALRAAGLDAVVSQSLPKAASPHVVLIWSAALEAGHAIDAQALIGLWSEDRLLVARRDTTPLPLGLRDLPSLGPEATSKDIVDAVRPDATVVGSMGDLSSLAKPAASVMVGATEGIETTANQEVELEFWRAIKDGNDPDDFELYVQQYPTGIYAALAKRKLAKLRGSMPEDAGAAGLEMRELDEGPTEKKWMGVVIGALVALVIVGGGGWYYYNKSSLAKQGALTAMLENATRATEELKQAHVAELEALKALERARADEEAARQAGDPSKLREAQEAVKRAETEVAKQAEQVKAREAAAADARRQAQEAAERSKAVAKAPAPKSPEAGTPAVVAAAPKAEAPKAEAPEAEAKSAPIPMPRSARSTAPTEVASASSAKVPDPDYATLYQQALAMEQEGKAAESVRIYRRAARAGSGKAARRLGEIYDKGVPGVPRDYAEALQWYEAARQLGESIPIAGRGGGAAVAPTPVPAPPAAPAAIPEPPKAAVPVPPSLPTPVSPKAAAEPATSGPEPKSGWFSWRGLLIALLVLALIAWRRARRREKAMARKGQRQPLDAIDSSPAQATVLFAGLSDGTKLVHNAGDQAAKAAVDECVRIARACTEASKGRVIKIVGGEVMSAFSTADAAADAAIQMQVAIDDLKPVGDIKIGYRIGFSHGPIQIQADGDFLGDAVNVAARLSHVAVRGQIITARDTVMLMSPILKSATRKITAIQIKGRAAEVEVYELMWQQSEDASTLGAARSDYKPRKDARRAAPQGDAALFVSYSHKDRPRVEPIVSVIEEMGRRVWMDRTDITGQTGWAGQIVRAIRECRAVVLMASPNSYTSDQVVRELYLAMNHRKTIVPIEIEPAEMPDELQYILAPFQHHRLSAGETRAVLGRALAAV